MFYGATVLDSIARIALIGNAMSRPGRLISPPLIFITVTDTPNIACHSAVFIVCSYPAVCENLFFLTPTLTASRAFWPVSQSVSHRLFSPASETTNLLTRNYSRAPPRHSGKPRIVGGWRLACALPEPRSFTSGSRLSSIDNKCRKV